MAGRKLQWCQLQSRPRPSNGLRAMEWGSDRQVACRQTWAGQQVLLLLEFWPWPPSVARFREDGCVEWDGQKYACTTVRVILSRRLPTHKYTREVRRCWCQDEGRPLSSRLHHPISTRRRRWGWHAASRRCIWIN